MPENIQVLRETASTKAGVVFNLFGHDFATPWLLGLNRQQDYLQIEHAEGAGHTRIHATRNFPIQLPKSGITLELGHDKMNIYTNGQDQMGYQTPIFAPRGIQVKIEDNTIHAQAALPRGSHITVTKSSDIRPDLTFIIT